MTWPADLVVYLWYTDQLGLVWVAIIGVLIAAAVAGCTAEANYRPNRQVSALRKQNAALRLQVRQQRNRAIDAELEQAQLLTEINLLRTEVNRQCELNEHLITERDDAWRQAFTVDVARRES